MSQTPIKGMSKFHTISVEDSLNKNGFTATTAYRLTQRKSKSVLANPQNLSTTLISIDHPNLSLPKINKKKKEKKQGTFLQSWLDEALGAPDPFAPQKQTEDQKIEGNVLKTLKKYDLDKRHLQSQNIPGEKVEKLYKSLYIYSHGVNKIFENLLQLTQQKGNNELIGNFWKAYTKLLESCTSYQTVFQKVQRDHLENINRLKRLIETRSQLFEEQKKELQAKLNKVEKKNEEKQNLYMNLKNQYDVLQNTLDLTDEAFNEEVNLRLKFEEKINAVYTSYEQLKNKYHKIVEEMGVKNEAIMEIESKEEELKSKLLAQRTKVDELKFLLKIEKDKLAERETQIIIKNQELEDARATILAKSNQEDNTHDKIEQYLIKMKALRAKVIEAENVSIGQKITIKEQEEHIKKLRQSLEEYKLHNDEVYEKYAKSGKKIVNLESEIQKNNMKIIEIEKRVRQKSAQIVDITRELIHVKGERDNLQHEFNISSRNLKDAADTVAKNNVLLDEMKAIKDKYQRINEYLKESVKELENSNNKLTQELSVKTEEIEGMKLLVESKSKALAQAEKQIEQERQIAKTKMNSLNVLIAKKEALSLEYQKKKQEQEKQISDSKILLDMTEEKCVLLDSEKIKLEVQLSSKTKMLKELETLLDEENKKFKDLNVKFEGEMKQKSDINSKLITTEFVLKTKNEEQRVEVTSLSALLNDYKSKIIERAQYVHPMLYEQALQTARRCFRNQEKAKKDILKVKNQSSELNSEFKKLETLCKQQKQKISQLQSKISSLTEQKMKLFEKLNKLEKSMKQKANLLQNSQLIISNLKQEVDRKIKAEGSMKLKRQQLEETITNLKIKNEELLMEAKKKAKNQSRETKRQVIKVATDQRQTQTDSISSPEPNTEAIVSKMQTTEQQVQTDEIEPLVEKNELMPAMYTSHNKEIKEIIQQPAFRKEENPQRRIESKDFRKALKLTYMRR